MGYRAALLNFSKGSISPELEARFDLPAYQAALRQATNVKIKRTGGVSKRMGTRFVAEAPSLTARLFPFQFSDDQAYALAFSQGKMQPFALGGAVLEEALAVSAITKAAAAQITSAFHGYAVGDLVYLTSILGMTEINNRFLTVASVIDASNFTVSHDTTAYGTFTGSGGGTVRTGIPSAPPVPPVVPAVLVDPPGPTPGTGSIGGYAAGIDPAQPFREWYMPDAGQWRQL